MKQVLSEEQQNIAFFNKCEGAILVEAAAGSGKTRILTERVRHLIMEKENKFFSVLCLTFTNKAADEMKERLENDIPKLKERVFIGNFHEFCLNNIIRSQRQVIGLQEMPHIFDETDKKKIIEEVLLMNDTLKNIYQFPNAKTPQEKAKKQQELISQCVDFISTAKRNLIIIPDEISSLEGWTKERVFLYKNYNYKLANQNAIDYDDILLYAYRILVERPRIAELYRDLYEYILVDEAQDLNYAQYQILRVICGDTHKNVMMVGDPKQAIYAFNGASPDFMQKDFISDFGAIKKEITKNYRSSTKVLELAQYIQPNGGIPNNYFEGIREIKSFEDEKSEAKWVIAKIKEWLNKGYYKEENKEVEIPIGIENIAVLSRTRYIFKDLITELENDEILKSKFYLRKGSEKFEPESVFMKIFDWGLRVIINPLDVLHFNQIYQMLKVEIPRKDNRLEHLLQLNNFDNYANLPKNQVDLLTKSWKELNENPTRLDMILNTLKEGLSHLKIQDEEKIIIHFDIQKFEELWTGFLMNTASNKQSLANFRYFLAVKSVDENKKGITLSTIHTVKGLEFEVVFLIGMNDDVLPFYKAKTLKEIAEEKNNAYVAVTRAKHCIYVTYPLSRIMWDKPKARQTSRFITGFKS
jgi:DNA helicase-2/ATP-dependent DNA helicase PcrA